MPPAAACSPMWSPAESMGFRQGARPPGGRSGPKPPLLGCGGSRSPLTSSGLPCSAAAWCRRSGACSLPGSSGASSGSSGSSGCATWCCRGVVRAIDPSMACSIRSAASAALTVGTSSITARGA
eukprot:scaffold101854_cov48-Phaeocystis_antarctica.AAC.1